MNIDLLEQQLQNSENPNDLFFVNLVFGLLPTFDESLIYKDVNKDASIAKKS